MEAIIRIECPVHVEPNDIVLALNNNDEEILGFIVEVLEQAQSSELRERLATLLASWTEDGRP